MKPEKKLIKDLNERLGAHTIRLKVIEKSNTQISPKSKGSKYQKIVFQDEEGGKIRTTLYGDEIEAYEDLIHDKMEYEITNAKIKVLPEKYRGTADHPYQLGFGAQTIIRPVEGCNPPLGPDYITIAAIPKTVAAEERYDIVVILIYVEPLREIQRPNGETLNVREFVVMDSSTEQPLTITAWSELATREGEQLGELVRTYPVIGITGLRPSHHKGFSLSTTSSTFVKLSPVGEKADFLRTWRTSNAAMVDSKCRQVMTTREPSKSRITTSIKNLRAKKAIATLQDERHWLHVSIPEFDRKDVRFYLGCNYCGASSKLGLDMTYNCETCKRKGVLSVPRMNITFEAIDDTGSIMLTAFNIDSEKLLQEKVEVLYAMEQEVKQEYLEDAEARLRDALIYVQVGPATSLSRNGVLKWVLKLISEE